MTTPTGLELVWANAGGASDPGDAKYQLGWVSEIPTFQNFNFVLQNLDKAKLAYAEGDIYPWQDKIAYLAGARVMRGDKTFYCINNHNDAAGSDPQDPELDATNSYWINGTVFSSMADAFTNMTAAEGVKIDQVNSRTANNLWEGNELTLSNLSNIIAFNNSGAGTDNLLFGNVRGKMVIVNVGNTTSPDSQDLVPANNAKAYEVFHEGHAPTQSEVDGTIPENPAGGVLYARRNDNWVKVTTTSVSNAPPPPVVGDGATWYNLDDGRLYIDINDGDSSQWVPCSPPIVADLEPIKQRVADLSNAFVGMESFFPPRAGNGVHPAWIEKAGGVFSRLAYPMLWGWAEAHGLVVSESAWQGIKAASPNGSVSVFSSGDGTGTFRAPDVGESGGFARAIKGATGADVPVGDLDGGFEDQIQNITGNMGAQGNSNPTGAIGKYQDAPTSVTGSNYGMQFLNFDASRVARTGSETSPRGSYQRTYIYTGNIVENLPTPTPNWLAQQEANTNAITDMQKYLTNNMLINPTFMEWQRGPSFNVNKTSAYTADRLVCAFSGDATVHLVDRGTTGLFFSRARVTGRASGFTYGWCGQRIENLNCEDLVGKDVTFTVEYILNHNQEVKLTLLNPTASNDYAGTELVGSKAFNLIPTKVKKVDTISATFYNMPEGVVNGLMAQIEFETGMDGTGNQAIEIKSMKVERGTTSTPCIPPEVTANRNQCLRYCEATSTSGAGAVLNIFHPFKITKRIIPTLIGVPVGADFVDWYGFRTNAAANVFTYRAEAEIW